MGCAVLIENINHIRIYKRRHKYCIYKIERNIDDKHDKFKTFENPPEKNIDVDDEYNITIIKLSVYIIFI